MVKTIRQKPTFAAGAEINGVTLTPITTTQRNALAASEGQIIYNKTTEQVEKFHGTEWQPVSNLEMLSGVYVPFGSLDSFQQRRYVSGVWIGDSTVNGDVGGFDLTNGGQGSAAELLNGSLYASFGLLGPGFYGMWRDEWVVVNGAGAGVWTLTNTSSNRDMAPFGWMQLASPGATDATATFTIPPQLNPTHADIVFGDVGVTSTWQWSYATSTDGITFTTFVNVVPNFISGLPFISRRRLALPAGTKAVRIRAANAAGVAKFAAIAGIVLHDKDPALNLGGTLHNIGASSDFLSVFERTGTGPPRPHALLWNMNPTLVIGGPFTNDSAAGTTFETNLRKLIQAFKTRTVVDLVTTVGTGITSATALFDKAADIGKSIRGGTIPAGATIVDVTNATTATLSAAATAAATVTAVIAPQQIRILNDVATTNASQDITSLSAAFSLGDIGKTFTGTNIQAGTTIQNVTSDSAAKLSKASTGTGSALPGVITGQDIDADILLIAQFQQMLTVTVPTVSTVNGSPIITGPSGTFNLDMKGRTVTGTGIQGLARIASVESTTSATLSSNATATSGGTPITLTLAGRVQADIDDLRAAVRSVARGVTVTDAVTTDGSSTVTSATAEWTDNDVGKVVVGANIPTNAYIFQRTNATTIVLSRPAIGSSAGGPLTMRGYACLDMGEAWYDTGLRNHQEGLLLDALHEEQKGHKNLANKIKSVLELSS